jgi:phosphohistidine phosphatase SixA
MQMPGLLWGLCRPLVPALLGACASLWAGGTVAQNTPADWSAVRDGHIVLFRHANAPGVGDPPQFRLGDCSTQRNLDETGRAQARRIGGQFRQRQIPVRQVLTSQWCRTRETAQLAFPGQTVQDEPAFNSFFGDASASPAQTAAARARLMAWKGPGVLVVVTHQVNISALTGTFSASGEGIVVRPGRDGLDVLGRVQP